MRSTLTERFDLVASPASDGYQYYFFPQRGTPIDGGTTSAADLEGMDGFVGSTYYTSLRDATDGTLSDRGIRTHLRNLRGLGNQLYKDVIPSELKDAVACMNEGDLLHVLTDEPRIPWELVKNSGDFWGQLYVISNSLMSGDGRVEPESFTLRIGKILNVIGHGIAGGIATRARELFQDFREKADIHLIDGGNDPDATDRFYEELPTADLIHFTGHGLVGSAGAYLQIVKDKASSANFMATSIGQNSLRPGCIVFANACSSGESKTVIRRSLGFGPSFCQGGAKAFIGTLDPVSAYPAVRFAEDFYDRLFSGHEIGKALRAAKQVPWKYKGETSLVPLLYSLYGNPYERAEL
jgi:hypothetical protein